jgi:branched-chain amino acid transport system substrate-binding protein
MNAAALRAIVCCLGLMAYASSSPAQEKYGPGVSDTEIKIGQTNTYSGPASSYGTIGKVEAAYINKINAAGGVNGRKINFISLDDAYSPPKAVEQVRKLVDQDNVLALMGIMGTPSNLAVAKYVNNNGVPQLLSATGSPKLNDPHTYPWTTVFYLPQEVEGRLLGQWLLKEKPRAKIGVLYQNDDFGKGYLTGLKVALGEAASKMIVQEESYQLSDPTVDSQLLVLKAAGIDTIYIAAAPKFAAQALRKISELGWNVERIITGASSSMRTVLQPAGLEAAKGVLATLYIKNPDDPMWANDQATKDYLAFMKEWAPNEPASESFAVMGYSVGQMMVELLRRCGDNLTRENLLSVATNIKGYQLPMFIPGLEINVTPNDRVAMKQARLGKFSGTGWEFVSDVVSIRQDQ